MNSGPGLAGLAIKTITIYKRVLSPLMGPRCRFEPTCSSYMIEAIQARGVFTGMGLGVLRILRCHPFSRGGLDPVPAPPERAMQGRARV